MIYGMLNPNIDFLKWLIMIIRPIRKHITIFCIFLHNINADIYKNYTIIFYNEYVYKKIEGEYGAYLDLISDSFGKESKWKLAQYNAFKKKYGEGYYTKKLNYYLNN